MAIQESAEKSDAKALQLAAYSLRSSSAHIGAMHLSALAKDLEMMGRSCTLEGALEKVRRSCESSSIRPSRRWKRT